MNDNDSLHRYMQLLDIINPRAAEIQRHHGKVPDDHPEPESLVKAFLLSKARREQVQRSNRRRIPSPSVLYTYPPCTQPFDELFPLSISELRLEERHRGGYLVVRTLTPADEEDAVMAIVEDEPGTAILLELYNQPDEHVISKDYILQQDQLYLVREPLVKMLAPGKYSLRIDHLSDIIWLQEGDTRIPRVWKKEPTKASSKEMRLLGNDAVHAQKWVEAEHLYSRAITIAQNKEEEQIAYLNRSWVNLRLDRPEKALSDARMSNGSEKALFREAMALYALGSFEDCLEKLTACVRINPKNTNAWTNVKRTKQRIREKESGQYDFSAMYEQAKTSPPLLDCATFVGPVEALDSPGKGKGLFTTKAVKAGDLLFCEKAFAYRNTGDDFLAGQSNTAIPTVSRRKDGSPVLTTQILQKLYHNPRMAESFTALYHGGLYSVTDSTTVDGVPVVDSFLVPLIIRANSFSTPRTAYRAGTAFKVETAFGIWLLASRINHSCFANCQASFIGDMLIVRAAQNMAKKTELLVAYTEPTEELRYAERQETFRSWNFVCDCVICLDLKVRTRLVADERAAMINQIAQFAKSGWSERKFTWAIQILTELEKTYDVRQNRNGAPIRLELGTPYLKIGAGLTRKQKHAEALEMLVRFLEALGFDIVAHLPKNPLFGNIRRQGVNTFEIKRWGLPCEALERILLAIAQAYAFVAPELVVLVRRYVKIARNIHFGWA